MSDKIDFDQFDKNYSGLAKLLAFGYHVYMVTVGMLTEPEKYEKYVDTFNEFVEYQKEREGLSDSESDSESEEESVESHSENPE